MSGGADMFKVLSQTENVMALIADTRPSLVVDRTGSQLLWANGAGAAFFGVATIDKLTALRFSAASPFARRIAALDDTLVSGQDRIERLPLQRGLLPRPTVCKASRVVADGVKAILLTIVDGTSSLAGDPTAAFVALTATAHPEIAPEPANPAEAGAEAEPEATEDTGELAGTDVAEPVDAVSEEIAFEAAPGSDEPDAEATAPTAIEAADATPEEATSSPAETTREEASAEPVAIFAEAAVDDAAIEDADAAAEAASSEPAEEKTVAVVEETPSETVETHEVSVEDILTAPEADLEATGEESPLQPVEASQVIAEPAFVFLAHGRAVRFVFELDPQLAFTFVSADLAATVGPGMADILGRTWMEVAGRLEFDPAGRIAEALGRRDTFTGLTVDWPVEGESLRVPTDLAGMPVFGRERSFRGYRGFGVLKTGAVFEAPVPAEPIAISAPDEVVPLPPAAENEPEHIVDGLAAPEASTDVDVVDVESTPTATPERVDDLPPVDEVVPEELNPAQMETAIEEPNAATESTEESNRVEPADVAESSVSEASGDEVQERAAEIVAPSEPIDQLEAGDTVALEEAGVDLPDEPVEFVAESISSASTISAEDLASEEATPAVEELAGIVPEGDLSASADSAGDEPIVAEDESAEADGLSEPLPLVTPPPEGDTADAASSEPSAPSGADIAPPPSTPRRTTFASLTGDKARALSKPERDAFDKIAEALADAFGPRILAEPSDRIIASQAPAISRKAEVSADTGPTVDIALLDKLPVALAILRGGDIIHANKAFLDLCGYPDVASIDADGGFAQVFEGAALSRDAAIPAIRRRDGVEIPVSARLHSMPMEGGIASLLVVQETVATTSRDRLATAEQRSEDMEAILDTATDGVLVLDHKGLVIGANKSAEALFGNERSHMIGMTFVDLLAPESHRSALDYLDGLSRNALSSVLNDGREVIGRVAGGGLVPLFMTVGRVSTTKFCAVLRDITQWKRAEEELTSAKKAAENASSQKSDFLAKMSHEIRTPLNAIIGFSEVMMEERFGPIGNDRYKEYLRDIHVSGTHIMSLVNDLLDLSKIEAGKLELTFEAVGLNDVVRECAALMQPQANRERIIIRTSLSSSLPPVVADNRSLRQIVLNLLSNAVKFNSAGGQVIVSTLYEESGEVVLRVRDTGQGMSEGDIVKAMEPFRQLSTSRTGGGTGLGLPLTKALVEANRAAFQIDSTPGQGTMIQITFPSTRVLAE